MKKLFLLVAMLVVSVSAGFAQFSFGDIYIGLGAAGLGFHSDSEKINAHFTPGAGLGFFITDKIAIEAAISTDSQKIDGESIEATGWGLGFRAILSDNLFSTISYQRAKAQTYDINVDMVGVGMQVGWDFFVTQYFFIEPTFDVLMVLDEKISGDGYYFGPSNGDGQMSAGLSLAIGFKF